MPTRPVPTLAELIGAPPGSIEGEWKVRRPENPEAVRRDHERDILATKIKAWLAGGALGLAFALCALFLHYERPEEAEKVVATLIGFVGGLGIGRSLSGKE